MESFDEWRHRETARAAVIAAGLKSRKSETRTETIRKYQEGNVSHVEISVRTGPLPDHLVENEAISPDGRIRLRVTQWQKGDHASTGVTLTFPTGSGPVYGTTGIRPDVRAYWKDNTTIVVETRKEYFTAVRFSEIRSLADTVRIEYIEY